MQPSYKKQGSKKKNRILDPIILFTDASIQVSEFITCRPPAKRIRGDFAPARTQAKS